MVNQTYVSVPKIIRAMLLDSWVCQPGGPALGGAVVGPSTAAQQTAGVVEVSERGFSTPHLYVDLDKFRLPLRCIANSVVGSENIKNAVFSFFDQRGLAYTRKVVYEPDTESEYLINGHWIERTTLPTNSDLKTYWECFVYICVNINTDPIEVE